ncbi:MAG: autotransporter outer membrane beta-barrel domain-containing protein [Methylovirgula sp.]
MFRLYTKAVIIFVAAVAFVNGSAGDAWSQTLSSLPLPPGQILTGQVFKPPFECPPNSVPSITNGADANLYILPSSCTAVPSFVPTAPAAMVVTSVPTQYVRFYCPTCTPSSAANRPFMADASTVRGLTPTQIQDVLALPYVPTMQTIVIVPAGSCVLVAKGGPAFGGAGGPAQEWAAGTPSGANCSGLQYLPLSAYINQQPIGAAALLYAPHAGGGNAGAVASALDRGPYPVPFTGMDGMYNSLDLLNYGDPAPLRAALVQLDGEIHASVQTVMLEDSLYLRETVLGRMRQAAFMGGIGPMAALASGGPALVSLNESGSSPTQPASTSFFAYADTREPASPIKVAPLPVAAPETVVWVQGVGAWGQIEGSGNAAGVSRDLAGLFAGVDRRFGSNWLAGIASGYTNSSVSMIDRGSSAGIDTAHLAGYVGATFGPWNLRSAAAASFSTLGTNRNVDFPGFSDSESASYHATTTQAFGELGYGIAFGQIATEPFAGLAFVHLNTGGFVETGGSGIAALSGAGNNDNIGYSTFGARAAINYALAYGLILTLRASAGWQHAVGAVTPAAALAFESNGATFTTSGVPLARDAALIQTGFDLHVDRQITFGVFYFGELANRVQDNSVTGNLIWHF